MHPNPPSLPAARKPTRLLPALALVSVICACGTTPTLRSEPLLPPPAMTEPCPPPPPLTAPDARSILANHIRSMRLYAICAQTKADLVRWIESQNLLRTQDAPR